MPQKKRNRGAQGRAVLEAMCLVNAADLDVRHAVEAALYRPLTGKVKRDEDVIRCTRCRAGVMFYILRSRGAFSNVRIEPNPDHEREAWASLEDSARRFGWREVGGSWVCGRH